MDCRKIVKKKSEPRVISLATVASRHTLRKERQGTPLRGIKKRDMGNGQLLSNPARSRGGPWAANSKVQSPVGGQKESEGQALHRNIGRTKRENKKGRTRKKVTQTKNLKGNDTFTFKE